VIPWNDQFRFFMTTKLPNPHYPPEVCVKVSLLNFTITLGGLEDQLLGVTIREERPELEEQKNTLVVSNAMMAKELKDIEDNILHLLSNSKGNILDDFDLIKALAQSKKKANEIDLKLTEAAAAEKEIDVVREQYRPVAYRGSLLYFGIADLALIDPMYQYSLQWFTMLFAKSCQDSEQNADFGVRRENLVNYFTFSLYKNICRSLFEKHKLLYSFMMCIRIQQGRQEIDDAEWRFLISGMAPGRAEVPNPDPSWIVERMWGEILAVSSLEAFAGLAESFDVAAWKRCYDSDTPQDEAFPGKWDLLPAFKKMCLLRTIRPDKVMPAVMTYVVGQMGRRFVEPPPFDINGSYEDSTNTTPLVFVLTSGSDPTKLVYAFAEEMRCKVQGLSLGQGQDVKAEKLITDGVQNGSWIFLQNCHLYVSWMGKLEALVDGINPDSCHKNFRLWLTSMPSLAFPVAILQNGVKMTLEPPAGLRANLKNAYFKLDDDKLNVTSKPGVYKKLLFALCFFHASVQDRRKFGPLGWNCPYEFNDTDLMISKSQAERFLDAYEYTPFKVLHFLTSYVNYGGRVTDYIDLRTIHVLLLDLFNEKVLEDNHPFSKSGTYRSIPFDADRPHKSYMDYIESLPLTSDPEAFGLHQNADIICAETETTKAFDTILSLQPKTVGGGGRSREDIINDIAQGIEDRMYPPFDTEAVSMEYPLTYSQCMNTVLLQECMRYNGLLEEMTRSLPLLRKALKGLVTMSQDLEMMADALFVAQIPVNWSENAYPSLKPLGPWVDELMERLAFLHDWIDHGVPPCFWVPGFYFPQAFFTGVRQNFARKHTLAIDTVDFDVRMLKAETKQEMQDAGDLIAPEDGCYVWGLWLEGARWNPESKSLDDSLPKQLYTRIPMIHMDPLANRPDTPSGVYRLPVYKTLERMGTLSTTGHSTNFIMWMEIPSDRSEFRNNLNEVDQDTWIRAGVAAFCALRY
jgi:dynein heavy chain